MNRRLTREERIIKFKDIHGNRYNYELVPEILYSTMKIPIICDKISEDGLTHGIFWQTVNSHQQTSGCPKCGGNYRQTKAEFINKALLIEEFSNYNYDYFTYKNGYTKGKIFCPKEGHGFFLKSPYGHINAKEGCLKCSREMLNNIYSSTTDDFIKKSKQIHINEFGESIYNYDLVKYKNAKTKVKIFCKKKGHGEFKQTPDSHLRGSGCYLCGVKTQGLKRLSTTQNFIKKAQKKHFDQEINEPIYDYTLTEYIKSKKNVKIICKIHGEFEQNPSKHLFGNGCPICKMSKGEIKIKSFLNDNKIEFIRQKKFDGCKNIRRLPFDFYLIDNNICIEYDGEQHFNPIKKFDSEKGLKKRQINDQIKNEYCKNNNLKLIRIKYTEDVKTILNKELKNIL